MTTLFFSVFVLLANFKSDKSLLQIFMASVDKSSQSVQAMFGAIAGRYDLLNHLLSANQDVRWRQRGVRLLGPKRGETILDLCCGTGDLAFEIARRQPRCEIIGGDFSEPMLEIARAKAERFPTRPQFVRADALHLHFDDATFDAVTVGFGVRNFENTASGLREMRRVLKPGGRVMILEFMRPESFFLRHVFGLFFKGILPRIGSLISRHNSAYSYLPASVGDFYSRREFENLLRECGFGEVRSFNFTLGAATCFLAKK
jgi:demethylmenaquinone methyltransferase / 2-methoxy-6-polyprenyl-1,4-benzoquinol methylase